MPVNIWQPAYDYSNQPVTISYSAAAPSSKNWLLCIVYPHLKDAYWLGVNYGMVQEAQRLGVQMRIAESGGYPNLERQRIQVKNCGTDPDVDALILGTVTFSGLQNEVARIAEKIPVLASVNDIANEGITGKVGVSWYRMGEIVGQYLMKRHAQTDHPISIAWFPGPKDAGWVPFVDKGFRDSIAGSAITITSTHWGDTGKTIQRNLVQEALDESPNIRYLVGNALMAEAAISILAERQIRDQVQILSTYFTPEFIGVLCEGKYWLRLQTLRFFRGDFPLARLSMF